MADIKLSTHHSKHSWENIYNSSPYSHCADPMDSNNFQSMITIKYQKMVKNDYF
jgi:hypothetical protein